MPLVITARNNGQYGGNLINQKYSPLEGILIDHPRPDYEGLFDGRTNILTAINAYPPNALNLYANFPAVNVGEAPLVVISSNRANWMRTILQNAVDHGAFAGGYSAANTFDNDVVPWYAPGRSGGRRVYVVVHWTEYDYYQERVGGFADVTVVGFKFTAARPALDIVGFGASRYAALQLAITLGYHRAWTVDDNVINVNGFPATLNLIEANMPAASTIWGISFNGATDNINRVALYAPGTVTFTATPYVFGTTTPGLLQQVVLWNVDLFRGANLNFSPLFVTSNEDTSLSNSLQASARDERIITAFRTIKIVPESDPDTNLGASTEIPKRRNRLLTIFNGIEYEIPIDPIGGAGQVPISRYVTATILPDAGQPQSGALAAQSRAIEQVMARAARDGFFPNNAFNPYYPAAGHVPVVVQALPATL